MKWFYTSKDQKIFPTFEILVNFFRTGRKNVTKILKNARKIKLQG